MFLIRMYIIMPRIGCMYAGSSGSSHGCNKNSPGNGNGKWQGLAPITNMRSSLIPYTRARAGGENRDYVFCVNQLAGGVGKRSGQFVPGAGGGVKDCTPTNRVDPAVLESVGILQAFAAAQGLIFALRGVEETINADIDELSTTSFHPFDHYLVQDALQFEKEYKLQADVRKAIKIINELKIELGVLSSADKQIHEATMVSQLDAIALADKGFGFEMPEVFGVHATPVNLYGTKYTDRIPILAVFAGGYAANCSNVPKAFLAAFPYVENPPYQVLGVVSENLFNVAPGPNLTDIIKNGSLKAFYERNPTSNPFPWVNSYANLDTATNAVMKMYKDTYTGNQSMTLTVAGTLLVVPSTYSYINEDKNYGATPLDFQAYLDTAPGLEVRTGLGSGIDPPLTPYRQIFNQTNDGAYDLVKHSDAFKKNVIGSTEQINDPNGLEDNVIVRRAFDYASGYSGDDAFQQLSGLKDAKTLLIFNALVGTNIVAKDNGSYFVAEKAISPLPPIGTLSCKQGS